MRQRYERISAFITRLEGVVGDDGQIPDLPALREMCPEANTLPDLRAFFMWLEICKANNRVGRTPVHLRVDADHSALLRRLLDGKQPLPEPPPLSYSYPWYDLVDNEYARPFEVREAEDDMFEVALGCDEKVLVINHSPWRIIRKLGKRDWKVAYGQSRSLWRVHSLGPSPYGSEGESISQIWEIRRLPEELP